MVILFGAVSMLSAALVFLVQPMVARMVLPTLGGSPQVWTTTMLFFQLALLVGYGYTHLTTTRLGPSRQTWLHIGLAAVVVVTLPIGISLSATPGTGLGPVFALLIGLLAGVAAPFVLLASTGPLVQRWLSWTDHPAGRDPYFLWVAGNLGSALGLLAYPFLIERAFSLRDQSRLWAIGYAVVVVLLALCARLVRNRPWTPGPVTSRNESTVDDDAPLPWKRMLRWVGIAAVPVSLTLGVTTTISTDIAAIPLMWVVPLFLYLVSYAVAFSKVGPAVLRITRWLGPATVMATLLIREVPIGLRGLIALYMALVLCGGLLAHGLLAADRPHPNRLTAFYLALAVGGVMGGLFNAVIAPLLFPVVLEHALAMAAVVALSVRWRIHFDADEPRRRALSLGSAFLVLGAALLIVDDLSGAGGVFPLSRLGLVLATALVLSVATRFGRSPLALVAALALGLTPSIQRVVDANFADRTFFGTHRIVTDGGIVFYYHGTTVHGTQDPSTPGTRRQPSAYYAPDGPVGDLMAVHGDGDLGILGLGVGSLAAYGRPGQTMVFHEIDPAVVDIASIWFTYLDDTEADIEIVLGDGRLTMGRVVGRYEWMIADAFTSDAVPMHLVTVEAIQTYLGAVEEGGTVVFHISNRYVDLKPVMRAAATELMLHAALAEEIGSWGTTWVAMSERPDRIDTLKARGWTDLPERSILWTDQRSNLLSVLR